MPYSTPDIRNIALVGQAGAGKTLLAEALLAQSGAIRSKGSLARGTTVCDFDPQEKALLHSLDTAICGFETQGKRVNIIDTPGYPDFLGPHAERARGRRDCRDRRQRRQRRRADDPAHDGIREDARAVPPDRRQQDRQPRGAHRGSAGRDPRDVRQGVPAAEPAGRRRRGRRRLLLPEHGQGDRLLVGRGRAHRDHRPGRRGRREPDGALPGAGRGAHARSNCTIRSSRRCARITWCRSASAPPKPEPAFPSCCRCWRASRRIRPKAIRRRS